MTWFVEHFFAPLGAYKPAGMFTWPHIVAFIVCVLLIRGAFSVSKNIPWKSVIKITRLLAVVLTALELVKIGYNFYYGYTDLDSWLPLSYCSLFIYACWMSGYGRVTETDSEGNSTIMNGVMFDITKRKTAEIALRKSWLASSAWLLLTPI